MVESNKEAAVSFLDLVASGSVRQAYAKYIGDGFKHHNPYFEGSAETLMKGMEDDYNQNPDKALVVKQVIAEGDFVVVFTHIRQTPEELGWAVAHIFRFENTRIAEMWDIGQKIPENSPNQYGIF